MKMNMKQIAIGSIKRTSRKRRLPHQKDLIVPSEECQKHHSGKTGPVSSIKLIFEYFPQKQGLTRNYGKKKSLLRQRKCTKA